MAQWVKALPLKSEGWAWGNQIAVKKKIKEEERNKNSKILIAKSFSEQHETIMAVQSGHLNFFKLSTRELVG